MGGAAVVVAAGAGYYFLGGGNGGNQSLDPDAQGGGQAGGGSVASEQLLVAGPLGEKVLGSDDAPVTIIEYASMTCGHCASFHIETLPALKTEFIDTGKARLIFREFPLDNVATMASMVARCARPESFFPLIGAMFQLQTSWAFSGQPVEDLQRVAQQAGFSQEEFNACLQNQAVLDGVNWVKERASREFDVRSTPTFFINGEIVRGNLPLAEFREKINAGFTS